MTKIKAISFCHCFSEEDKAQRHCGDPFWCLLRKMGRRNGAALREIVKVEDQDQEEKDTK